MNNKIGDVSKVEQSNEIKLCSFCTDKPFDAVIIDFEKQLGHFDHTAAISSSTLETTIKSMEGSSGLMIIGSLEMDAILPTLKRSFVKARQYHIGNPLIADKMAQHNTLAALYAPPRVLIYTQDGKTCISYDLPSTSFGKLSSSAIAKTAKDLDQKFEKLAMTALH